MRTATRTLRASSKGIAGELWALLAVVGYTGANLFGRAGVAFGNPIAAPLLRDLPSFLLGLALLARGGHAAQLIPGRPGFLGAKLALFVGSGLVSVVGTFAFFFALNVGGVNVAVPVLQTQLVWGALFGWLLMGERVTLRGMAGMGVTLAGLVVLAVGQSRGQPVSDAWFLGMLLALVPALAWGLSGVVWRRGQSHGVGRSAGMTVHYGTSVLTSFLFLAVSGQLGVYRTIRPEDLTALVASGVFAGVIASYAMFSALKLLPAATVFVLNGLTPMLTALGGAWFLGEYVNGLAWFGIGLTSAGVVAFQLLGAAAKGSDRTAAPRADRSGSRP